MSRARKDGSLVDLRITISPIFNGKDELVGLSGVCVDISEAKKAKQELDLLHRKLKESELKYRTLFEYANDAIYLLEIGSDHFPARFVEVNEAGCKRFGYTRKSFYPRLVTVLYLEILTLFKKQSKKFVTEIFLFTLQSQFTFKSGEIKKLEYSGKLFNIENKKVLLIVSRDRTEYLKTEELLQKSEKLAAVGQLATAIAHEIRNPLTAIKGFMQLLTEKASKEELTYMNIISSEIERIEMITDEFMSVAKPQAVTFQSIDLQLLIQQVILLLQPQATMKNIFIELNSYGEMPFVYCESNQMKQVFINILKNAIEAMPSGGEIKVELRKRTTIIFIFKLLMKV